MPSVRAEIYECLRRTALCSAVETAGPYARIAAFACAASFTSSPRCAAEAAATADSLSGNPTKGIEYFNVTFVKESKRIVLPTLYIRMMDWGRVTAVTQTSALQWMAGRRDSTVRDTKEIVASVDQELVRSVAAELYADLAAKLRTTGYEVVTHEEAKSNAILAALPLEKWIRKPESSPTR